MGRATWFFGVFLGNLQSNDAQAKGKESSSGAKHFDGGNYDGKKTET